MLREGRSFYCFDEMNKISVLGCGWLGLPLAKRLLEQGYIVNGSVTSTEKHAILRKAGIRPFCLILEADNAEVDDPRFFDAELVIVAIPPRRTEDVEIAFPDQIRQLILLLEQYHVPRVLFISSTSVYPETGGIVLEEDYLVPEKASGRALLEAERRLMQNNHFSTTVLRFGGLIGADRDPSRFLTRKKESLDGSKPVNLIHQDDCIQIIDQLIRHKVWGGVFNACCPVHPTRKEFYEMASTISGIAVPSFGEGTSSCKIVDSSKLISRIDYHFKYPSPLDWLVHN